MAAGITGTFFLSAEQKVSGNIFFVARFVRRDINFLCFVRIFG